MTSKELDDQREVNQQWSELLDITVVSPAVEEGRTAQNLREALHKAWQKNFASTKKAG